MKKLLSSIMVAVMLVSVGCGTTTPKKIAYTSLAAVGSAVNNAGDAVATARLQHKVSDNDWEQIVEAHRRYLAAYNTACTLAAYDFTKYAPEELIRLELDFLNMVNTVLGAK